MYETTPRPERITRSYIDPRSREYIYDRGWTIDAAGLIHVKPDASYLSKSLRYPDKLSLMIPTTHGLTLLFEGMHFVVD